MRGDRRPGRQARHLRDRLHLRLLPLAAVPDPLSRREAAMPQHRLGRGEKDLVPPAALRDAPERLAALDKGRPDLERHVCGVPLHQRDQGLQPGDGRLPHHLVRNKRGLRSLPRSGLETPRMGGQAAPGAQPHGQFRADRAHVQPLVPGPAQHLRALPFPALPARQQPPRPGQPLEPHGAGAAQRGHLLPRRPDPGRGLRVRLVYPEQDVRARRALRGLP